MLGLRRKKNAAEDFPDDEPSAPSIPSSTTPLSSPFMNTSRRSVHRDQMLQDPSIRSDSLRDLVPEEYFYDPLNAEPTLDHLRAAAAAVAGKVVSTYEEEEHPSDVTNNVNDHEEDRPFDTPRSKQASTGNARVSSLDTLMAAAQLDVNLHMARTKAVLHQDPSILHNYSIETDEMILERKERTSQMWKHKAALQLRSLDILRNLNEDMAAVGVPSDPTLQEEKTQAHLLQERMQSWEQALQLYIYCPAGHNDIGPAGTAAMSASDPTLLAPLEGSSTHSVSATSHTRTSPHPQPPNNSNLSLLQLLSNLSHQQDDENLTQALEQATQMTLTQLETTSTLLTDATDQTADALHSYHISTVAHSLVAQGTVEATQVLQDDFLSHGKEALKIGHALEAAETKRHQAHESANLLKRWWTMEHLAQQEESGLDRVSGSRGAGKIQVEEEVLGRIPSSACRMDPLFTRPERSLEAAKCLKSLRMICKCHSGNIQPRDLGTMEGGDADIDAENTSPPLPLAGEASQMLVDPHANRRFQLTEKLITRTSVALEKRLLDAFHAVYVKGGVYDFTSTHTAKRPGRLDWVSLRDITEALMNFDSGRSLHKLYVGSVVATKFPELFPSDIKDEIIGKGVDLDELSLDGQEHLSETKVDVYGDSDDDEDEEEEPLDIDATRSRLSNLFHRVCEVCTEEFQLIAHVFSPALPHHLQDTETSASSLALSSSSRRKHIANANAISASFPEAFPMQVARSLLQRIISDPQNGVQAHINGLLESIDRRGDFDSGSKKLDVFVVLHEKAAGLFNLLKDAAQQMWGSPSTEVVRNVGMDVSNHMDVQIQGQAGNIAAYKSNTQAVSSLIQFLTSQEIALSSGQRRGYLNLELRLLHHECCANLDRIGAKLLNPVKSAENRNRNKSGSELAEYRAPIMPLNKDYLRKIGFLGILNGPLKQSVLRQPLIHATDALARARLMFGSRGGGGENIDSTARVVVSIFIQMCNFYGFSYLFPIVESLGTMLVSNPPSSPPTLPFDENSLPHDLGVDGNFWISIERIHSAAKSFDRELWAENRTGSIRVWEILVETRSPTSMTLAKDRRIRFFQELEERGEIVILRALDALSSHIQWILVSGGESTTRTGTTRLNLGGTGGGPYAVSAGSLIDSTSSPAVKALTFCLRAQFVHVQAALTPQSLSAFWIALSMRLFNILVARLLQHYTVSTTGAVILSRDVDALRSVAMLAGDEHSHWDNLLELITLYMTPPDALKTMLVGPDGDINSGKGMFGRVGKDYSIVFMSRRVDYRYRTNQGMKKSQWANELLEDLGMHDITDGKVNIALYSAENMIDKV